MRHVTASKVWEPHRLLSSVLHLCVLVVKNLPLSSLSRRMSSRPEAIPLPVPTMQPSFVYLGPDVEEMSRSQDNAETRQIVPDIEHYGTLQHHFIPRKKSRSEQGWPP